MTIFFSYPGYEKLADQLVAKLGITKGSANFHCFPDGETLVRLDTPVQGQEVILLCGLEYPDTKTMALMFFAETAKELGATRVGLIAPYLSYMRQDRRFQEGEAVTSVLFGKFISQHFNWLVTVEPHLHRRQSMNEIYTIPALSFYAVDLIAQWIQQHIPKPVLIGPDHESENRIRSVAEKINAPYFVFEKKRHGDKEVEMIDVSVPDITRYAHHTPVLIDDIISTGRTLAKALQYLQQNRMQDAVCIAVHGLFSDDALDVLAKAGAKKIITCNTVPHATNALDVSNIIFQGVKQCLGYKN